MQDAGYGLLRMPLLGAWVNMTIKKGGSPYFTIRPRGTVQTGDVIVNEARKQVFTLSIDFQIRLISRQIASYDENHPFLNKHIPPHNLAFIHYICMTDQYSFHKICFWWFGFVYLPFVNFLKLKNHVR
jgi:hypothetical protein